MPLYSYKDVSPKLGEGCFVSDTTVLTGKVECGDNVNLWFGVVARGDDNKITIGNDCNIQDLTMLHVTEDFPLVIGDGVSVGHNAVLHGCTVEDNCLIGMGAIVLDGAVIGKNSVVAAGSVVAPGKVYPPNSMIMGSPASVKRELNPAEKEGYGKHYLSYIQTKNDYLNPDIVKRID